MAKPKEYQDVACKDPWKVAESAKTAVASPFFEELAKPKYQSPPVERYPPPREVDAYGRFIFPKPVLGISKNIK